MWRKKHTAFTLVELLVVIGIIALLISMLLPALNKARQAAQAVNCLSNLRQVGNAVMFYVQDNKGTMPYVYDADIYYDSYNAAGGKSLSGAWWTISDSTGFADTWTNKYIPRTKGGVGALVCPSFPAMGVNTFYPNNCGNYGLNYHMFAFQYQYRMTPSFTPYHKLSQVKRSAEVMFACDVKSDLNAGGTVATYDWFQWTVGTYNNNHWKGADFRHNKQLNILYGDFHAAPSRDRLDDPADDGSGRTTVKMNLWSGGSPAFQKPF
jgi:prepilin-type N-terminal cleavage/methylation domain-containing protein/prepilin-type processing-associated H-X9-DG protein